MQAARIITSGALALLLQVAWPIAQAQAQPTTSGDPLRSPACLSSRSELDAAEAASRRNAPDLLRLRQQVARICLRATANTAPPARVTPPVAVPSTTRVPPPRLATRPTVPALQSTSPAPVPAQTARCDAGGCRDSNNVRLNRSGPYLVDQQGRMCTQQGTVLVCP